MNKELHDELVGILWDAQEEWRTEDPDTALPWFADLELESVHASDCVATFILVDPADGSRHGWRWRIAPDERDAVMYTHLKDDLENTERTDDAGGVRWWGVHLRQYV